MKKKNKKIRIGLTGDTELYLFLPQKGKNQRLVKMRLCDIYFVQYQNHVLRGTTKSTRWENFLGIGDQGGKSLGIQPYSRKFQVGCSLTSLLADLIWFGPRIDVCFQKKRMWIGGRLFPHPERTKPEAQAKLKIELYNSQ